MDTKDITPIERFIALLAYSHLYKKRKELLYQYTDISALCNGILGENREKGKEITIWASSLSYMNDPKEFDAGARIAKKLLKEHFDTQLKISREVVEELKHGVYVASFTPNVDCLPMWNMYGNNGHGIALGFDPQKLVDSHLLMYKCLYNSKEKVNSLIKQWEDLLNQPIHYIEQGILENIHREGHPHESLLTMLMLVSKDLGYEYEDEVRATIVSDENVKFRYGRGFIIPYKEVYIPAEALKEIWIGPSIDSERAKRSIRAYLNHLGMENVRVRKSAIPYQTF